MYWLIWSGSNKSKCWDSNFSVERELAEWLLSDVWRPENSSGNLRWIQILKQDTIKWWYWKKLNGLRSLAWHLWDNITRERGDLSSPEFSLVSIDLDLWASKIILHDYLSCCSPLLQLQGSCFVVCSSCHA